MAVQPAAGLQEALKEAIEESEFTTDEAAQAADEWDGFPLSGEDDTRESSTAATPNDGEAPEADEVQDEDPPESYWGVDLSDISPERRAEIIAHFEQQDSTIAKLQQRLTSEPEAPAPANTEEPEEITDEDLARAIGLDPDDYSDQALMPKVLPLARTIVNLETQVEQMSQERTVEKATTAWNGQLDDLEGTYGKLPFDRVQVLRYAVEEGIASPFEAYFKLSAPVRQEVETRAAQARKVAEKRTASVGVKPRASQGGEVPALKPGLSLRDAVAQAAKAAEAETKIPWKDALKKRLTVVPDE